MPLQLRCDEDSSEVFFFADDYESFDKGDAFQQLKLEKDETCLRENNDDDNHVKQPLMKKRRKSRQLVHFATDSQQVFPHLHYRDVTEEEKFAYWMSRAELQQTRYEAVYISSLITRSQHGADESVFSMRGLEPRDLDCISTARDCVLKNMSPNGKEQQLSNLYRVQTQDAERKARLRGISDAEEAYNCHNADENKSP